MITVVDCRGMTCPRPVIETRDALEKTAAGTIAVIVDNEASQKNVERFAASRGCTVKTEVLGDGCFRISVAKKAGDDGAGATSDFRSEDYACEIPSGSGLVYVIAADTMGRGDDELGWGLMQTYIQTIKDVRPLPTKILLYNSGVKLVASESGALDALCELRDRGVEILACGTCLDFFKLKAKIKVGRISNMYDIMSSMNEAAKVVSPL